MQFPERLENTPFTIVFVYIIGNSLTQVNYSGPTIHSLPIYSRALVPSFEVTISSISLMLDDTHRVFLDFVQK